MTYDLPQPKPPNDPSAFSNDADMKSTSSIWNVKIWLNKNYIYAVLKHSLIAIFRVLLGVIAEGF